MLLTLVANYNQSLARVGNIHFESAWDGYLRNDFVIGKLKLNDIRTVSTHLRTLCCLRNRIGKNHSSKVGERNLKTIHPIVFHNPFDVLATQSRAGIRSRNRLIIPLSC
jgi:hypothetical protein